MQIDWESACHRFELQIIELRATDSKNWKQKVEHKESTTVQQNIVLFKSQNPTSIKLNIAPKTWVNAILQKSSQNPVLVVKIGISNR